MITDLSPKNIENAIKKFTTDLVGVTEEIAETDHPAVLPVHQLELSNAAVNLGLAFVAALAVGKKISLHDFDLLQLEFLEMRLATRKVFKKQIQSRLNKEHDPDVADYFREIIRDVEQDVVAMIAALDQTRAALRSRDE